MLCSCPSFLRKQESRPSAPLAAGCRIKSGMTRADWYDYNVS